MSKVLADNWSLQNTAELLTNGLAGDDASVITIDTEKNTHAYQDISYDIIRIEALFDLLNDIVLKDEIIVDDQYLNTWNEKDSALLHLCSSQIIKPFPFLAAPDKLRDWTNALVKKLCVTSSLELEHELNNQTWQAQRKVAYPALSSTLWGGAGMLARSHVYECNYTPHPLRKRLFVNTGVFTDKPDAASQLHNLIHTKRVQLFNKKTQTDSLYSAFLHLPPIPFRIIEESSSIKDLFVVAMQLRETFTELRQWLNQFQNAIDNEDVADMLRYEKVLSSVSSYVDQRISGNGAERMEMSVNLSYLSLTLFKGDPINHIRNQLGIRSTINSLIFDKPGRQALKKLLHFFGEENSSAGINVYQHFASSTA